MVSISFGDTYKFGSDRKCEELAVKSESQVMSSTISLYSFVKRQIK